MFGMGASLSRLGSYMLDSAGANAVVRNSPFLCSDKALEKPKLEQVAGRSHEI